MSTAIIPIPNANVNVRLATMDDLPFVDSLQKMHSDNVGFLKTAALLGKIKAEQLFVAWASRPCALAGERMGETPMPQGEERVGYVIAQDRYYKRDDLGIIFHLNVVPGKQRGFVGAAMLKAMFDRAAYGCRLFCCWCAQDIQANKFWEAMGFVPLAYRAGSEKKRRVHIFWQKRIRENDTKTPWWFPCATNAGAMSADRIVLPIPPGKHWSDEMPVILPAEPAAISNCDSDPSLCKVNKAKPQSVGPVSHRPRQFGPPPAKPLPAPEPPEANTVEKPKRAKKPKAKNDPKLVAAAREFRDRYLEQVNDGTMLLEGAGKYDVVRALREVADVSSRHRLIPTSARMLPAA